MSSDMASAAARLLADPAALAALRRNLGRLPENRAVYEVLDFIGDAVADQCAGPSRTAFMNSSSVASV